MKLSTNIPNLHKVLLDQGDGIRAWMLCIPSDTMARTPTERTVSSGSLTLAESSELKLPIYLSEHGSIVHEPFRGWHWHNESKFFAGRLNSNTDLFNML